MDDRTILEQLEALCARVSLTVRYEPLKIEGTLHTGGYCRVRGRDFVIINKKAATKDKIHVLTGALKRYDLGPLYLVPSLRKILGEGEGKSEPGHNQETGPGEPADSTSRIFTERSPNMKGF